ncbi:MAG: hypothetical protein B7Y41_13480 [Hydrogenophilales bacterium 28-61-23]|nr:MAG: hypothetical protein B7Y41_13480 [Hydrogenophilales bacterium 28-61-23]
MPIRNARAGLISGINPTIPARMTPPQPLLSLTGCSGVPATPWRNALMEVFPGARWACIAACLSSLDA